MQTKFHQILSLALLLSATHYSATHAAEQTAAPVQKWKPLSEQDIKIAQEKRNLLSDKQKQDLDNLLIQTIAQKSSISTNPKHIKV